MFAISFLPTILSCISDLPAGLLFLCSWSLFFRTSLSEALGCKLWRFLSENVLILFSFLKNSFRGYRILRWQLPSLLLEGVTLLSSGFQSFFENAVISLFDVPFLGNLFYLRLLLKFSLSLWYSVVSLRCVRWRSPFMLLGVHWAVWIWGFASFTVLENSSYFLPEFDFPLLSLTSPSGTLIRYMLYLLILSPHVS